MAYVLPVLTAIIGAALFFGDWMRLSSSFLKVCAILSCAVFLAGFYVRVSLWARGAAGGGADTVPGLLYSGVVKFFSPECLFAARLFRTSILRGAVLLVTIWSFLALLAGTILVSLEYTLGADLTSSGIFSLAMDLSGLTLLLAVLFYIVRRLADKGAKAVTVMEDYLILWGFVLIILTGFLLEGARIAYLPGPDAAWSPVGLLISRLIKGPVAEENILRFKGIVYNLHAAIVFLFIAYIPFSKQFHMFASQIVTAGAKRSAREREKMMHET